MQNYEGEVFLKYYTIFNFLNKFTFTLNNLESVN